MPPIACTPRLWQLRITMREYARMKGCVIVTTPRSGRIFVGSSACDLMNEKM